MSSDRFASIEYNITNSSPLIRPPNLHWKSGLSCGGHFNILLLHVSWCICNLAW